MFEEDSKNSVDHLKEAEVKRIYAEINKIEEERRKIEIERKELEYNLRLPWFRKKTFLQAVVGGFVAIPLIWFYVTEIAIPLYNKENIKLEWQNEQALDSLNIARKDFQKKLLTLQNEKVEQSTKLVTQLNEIRSKYGELDSIRRLLAENYRKLSEQNQLTQNDRDKFKQKYETIQSQIKEQAKIEKGINAEIVEAKKIQKTESSSLTSFATKLRELFWGNGLNEGEKWAVIIGIDKYRSSQYHPLKFSVTDAKALRDLLVEYYKFNPNNVFTLFDEGATLANIKNTLGNKLFSSINQNDHLLIFWADHGDYRTISSDKNVGYLIPYDGDERNLFSSCFSMIEFNSFSDLVPSRHTLVLVDASYSGLAVSNYLGTRDARIAKSSNYELIEKIASKKAREIIAAGNGLGPVFEGSKWGHSAFVAALLSGLGRSFEADFNKDGVILSSELFFYLREKIFNLTEGRQVPAYGRLNGDEGGEMFFLGEAYSKTSSIQTPPETQGARR